MDFAIVDNHAQIFRCSCIPMAVELVLKLLGRKPADYYDLQKEVGERCDVGYSEFQRTIEGVQFKAQFARPRADDFPIDELFAEIDRRLQNGEYVIISIASPDGWHMYVFYDKTSGGDYRAVSKEWAKTITTENIKPLVREMKGTDILTYEFVAPSPATTPVSKTAG